MAERFKGESKPSDQEDRCFVYGCHARRAFASPMCWAHQGERAWSR